MKSIHFQDFTIAPFQIQYCNIYALEQVNPRMHIFLYQLFIADYMNPSNLYEPKQQELSFLPFMEFEFYGVSLISQMLPSGWSNETWTQAQWLYPIVSESFPSYGNYEDFPNFYSKNILIRKPPIVGRLYAFFFLHVVDVHVMQAKQKQLWWRKKMKVMWFTVEYYN